MSQKLRKIQDFLGVTYIPLLLILFILSALAIGWTSVKPNQYSFTLNEVAKETVRATKNIEDQEQTEINKKLAVDNVQDIYVYNKEIVTQQEEKLSNLFAQIKVVASKPSSEILASVAPNANSSTATNESSSSRAQVATNDQRTAYFKKNLDSLSSGLKDYAIFIPDWVITFLLTSSSEKLEAYESSLKTAVSFVMSDSLKEQGISVAQEEAKKQLFYGNYTDVERNVLNELVDNTIVTNNVVDIEATEAAKVAASNAVPPVRILQGQVIVQEGQVVDKADIRQLQLLGLTSGVANYHMISGYFAILVFVALFVLTDYYLSISKNNSENNRWSTKNRISAFLMIALIAILSLKIVESIQARGMDNFGLVFPMAGFIYLIMHSTKSRRYGVFAMVILSLSSWFIYNNESDFSLMIVLVSYYLLLGIISITIPIGKTNLPYIIEFLIFMVLHLVALIPWIFYSNYTFTSGPVLVMLVFAVANSILSYFMPLVFIPYLDLMFEDNSVLLLTNLSNPNQPLLKELISKAPGTYHHSLMVANISANCVEAIGGDSLLARVACYYHDIGKADHPFFFIENVPNGMENPHNFLSPRESKDIIFDHVTSGVKILKKYNLPQPIIDICAQHHGTTLMKFFYAKELENNPDCKEEDFRYPGPKPQTKEAAIISIVDSAEAACRAMKQPTIEKVRSLVKGIINSRIKDGQLNESTLTFNELALVEEKIIESLNGTFHSRIEYPTLQKDNEKKE